MAKVYMVFVGLRGISPMHMSGTYMCEDKEEADTKAYELACGLYRAHEGTTGIDSLETLTKANQHLDAPSIMAIYVARRNSRIMFDAKEDDLKVPEIANPGNRWTPTKSGAGFERVEGSIERPAPAFPPQGVRQWSATRGAETYTAPTKPTTVVETKKKEDDKPTIRIPRISRLPDLCLLDS